MPTRHDSQSTTCPVASLRERTRMYKFGCGRNKQTPKSMTSGDDHHMKNSEVREKCQNILKNVSIHKSKNTR